MNSDRITPQPIVTSVRLVWPEGRVQRAFHHFQKGHERNRQFELPRWNYNGEISHRCADPLAQDFPRRAHTLSHTQTDVRETSFDGGANGVRVSRVKPKKVMT